MMSLLLAVLFLQKWRESAGDRPVLLSFSVIVLASHIAESSFQEPVVDLLASDSAVVLVQLLTQSGIILLDLPVHELEPVP